MPAPAGPRNEMSSASSVGSSKVVRVGNVLQVVPTTSIDWSSNSQPVVDRKSGARYPIVPPSPANVPTSLPIPVPLPVPVPMPVNPAALGSTSSPVPLPLPIPISLPIPLALAPTVTPAKSKPTPPQGEPDFIV